MGFLEISGWPLCLLYVAAESNPQVQYEFSAPLYTMMRVNFAQNAPCHPVEEKTPLNLLRRYLSRPFIAEINNTIQVTFVI
jgi:hypothetical protein